MTLDLGSALTSGKDKTLFSPYLALNNVYDGTYQNYLKRLKSTTLNYATGRQSVFNMSRNLGTKLTLSLVCLFKQLSAGALEAA